MPKTFAALIFLSLLALPPRLAAQSPAREWILGLDVDATKYYGDFTDDRFQSGGRISLKRFLSELDRTSSLYLEGSFGAYELDYKTTGEMIRALKYSPEVKEAEVNRTLVAPIQFQLLWRKLIGPRGELFLGGGLELGYFQPYNHNGYPLPKPSEAYGKWEIGVPLSAQFEYMLGDLLALNFHTTLHFTSTDYLDGVGAGTGPDAYLTAGIGFSYSFPAPDRDDDFDGLTNREESEIYHTNPEDPDTDHDGLSDKEEIEHGTDPLRPDSDGDGITDGDEVHKYFTNPLAVDTDGDGLSDAEEIVRHTNPLATDTDGDNLSDQVEIARGTDPLNRDTDGDGLPDGMEANSSPLLRDTDGDGLPDAMESAYNLRPYDEDFDNDGLFDGQEIALGTDPKKADTDNDGVSDYAEVYGLMTDPRNPDTDGDGIPDGQDPDPLGTGVQPQKNVSASFESIFRHEHAVDETSKGLISLLHLIRCASPGHVRSIEITVTGETRAEAADRAKHLEEYLEGMIRHWGAPPVNVTAEVKPPGVPHARLVYVPK